MTVIELQSGPLTLGLCPNPGASIAYFRHNALPLLRETPPDAIATPDGRAFSAFPLIPFSNRIRAAAFTYAGAQYLLARDAEDPRHALHGTSRFAPWRLVRQTDTYARCTCDHTPSNLDWPFAYHAWQTFELLPDRLRVTLGLRNLHAATAPAGLGLHPYFVRTPQTTLRFDAGFVWAKDGQDIPTHAIPDTGRFSFGNAHPIEPARIDNDYGAWGRVLEISAPGRPTLTLAAAKPFTHLVLYTPENKPYFAAEPVTHRPDALHPIPDPNDAPMTQLRPGESLEGTIEIQVK